MSSDTSSERSSVEYAAHRALELRQQTLQTTIDEIVSWRCLTREAVIDHVERLRAEAEQRAGSLAQQSDAFDAIRKCDARARAFGRLLYFLRFGRCPTDMTQDERRLCDILSAEIARREQRRSVIRAGNELFEQARRHRMKAEEYRAVADQMRNPTARASYLQLARTYEAMASRCEANAESLRERGRNIG
jgi:hypothetical protein